MSSKLHSPTASLLRTSRFFSLPPALPRVTVEFGAALQGNQQSDTATAPYPTQQAITTSPSSLPRGDWGLKRPLPHRSTTKSSTPVLRVNAVDTREHITDFESASDHTLTLRKIHELGVPVTKAADRLKYSASKTRISVFESSVDNTQESFGESDSRWKAGGPWLTNMTRGEFDSYVARELRRRKPEFIKFLRERCLEDLSAESNRIMREGVSQPTSPRTAFAEKEFVRYLKDLRSSNSSNSKIAQYITRFLDLPAIPTGAYLEGWKRQETGLPTTHPSAGISYKLVDAHVENHPILGPQARKAPFEARIVTSAPPNAVSYGARAFVGIAGIVSAAPNSEDWVTSNDDRLESSNSLPLNFRQRRARVKRLGVDMAGGNRSWMEPTSLEVDSKGRANLKIAHADGAAVLVHTGELIEQYLAQSSTRPATEPLLTGRLDDFPSELRQSESSSESKSTRAEVAEVVDILAGNSRN